MNSQQILRSRTKFSFTWNISFTKEYQYSTEDEITVHTSTTFSSPLNPEVGHSSNPPSHRRASVGGVVSTCKEQWRLHQHHYYYHYHHQLLAPATSSSGGWATTGLLLSYPTRQDLHHGSPILPCHHHHPRPSYYHQPRSSAAFPRPCPALLLLLLLLALPELLPATLLATGSQPSLIRFRFCY